MERHTETIGSANDNVCHVCVLFESEGGCIRLRSNTAERSPVMIVCPRSDLDAMYDRDNLGTTGIVFLRNSSCYEEWVELIREALQNQPFRFSSSQPVTLAPGGSISCHVVVVPFTYEDITLQKTNSPVHQHGEGDLSYFTSRDGIEDMHPGSLDAEVDASIVYVCLHTVNGGCIFLDKLVACLVAREDFLAATSLTLNSIFYFGQSTLPSKKIHDYYANCLRTGNRLCEGPAVYCVGRKMNVNCRFVLLFEDDYKQI